MLDIKPQLDGPQLAIYLQEPAVVLVTGATDVEEIRAPLALDCAEGAGDEPSGPGPSIFVTTWDTTHIDGTEITLPFHGDVDVGIEWRCHRPRGDR